METDVSMSAMSAFRRFPDGASRLFQTANVSALGDPRASRLEP